MRFSSTSNYYGQMQSILCIAGFEFRLIKFFKPGLLRYSTNCSLTKYLIPVTKESRKFSYGTNEFKRDIMSC